MEGIMLGARVRHKVTGFIGTVIAITYWLQGPVRVMLQEKLVNEGEINLIDGKMEGPLVVDAAALEEYVDPIMKRERKKK